MARPGDSAVPRPTGRQSSVGHRPRRTSTFRVSRTAFHFCLSLDLTHFFWPPPPSSGLFVSAANRLAGVACCDCDWIVIKEEAVDVGGRGLRKSNESREPVDRGFFLLPARTVVVWISRSDGSCLAKDVECDFIESAFPVRPRACPAPFWPVVSVLRSRLVPLAQICRDTDRFGFNRLSAPVESGFSGVAATA